MNNYNNNNYSRKKNKNLSKNIKLEYLRERKIKKIKRSLLMI